jgi:hypothetical protein
MDGSPFLVVVERRIERRVGVPPELGAVAAHETAAISGRCAFEDRSSRSGQRYDGRSPEDLRAEKAR